MPIEKELKKIVMDQLGVDPSEITLEAKFMNDLGADFLDIVELVRAIEKKFKIKISDEDTEKLTTVGNVVKYLKKKISRNNSL